jgi:hypothetical protein
METESKPLSAACHVCNKLFVNGDRLRAHFLYVHSGIKYDCALWEYSGASQGHVKEHTLGVHLRSRKWKCQLCDYAARTSTSRRMHFRRIQSKEKDQKCDLCDSSSFSKLGLSNHVRSLHHLKEKQEVCNICDFKTVTKANL